MAHIGHPILGDTLYPIPQPFVDVIRTAEGAAALAQPPEQVVGEVGVPSSAAEETAMLSLLQPLEGRVVLTVDSVPAEPAPWVHDAFPRLCLHALRLSFTHPTTQQPITLSALSTETHMVQAPPAVVVPSFKE
jgi:23S rRNA-/tRNA-specific pseudouridylate synthase